MAKPKLTLFIDTVSPFAYLAFYITTTSPIFKDCDVTYIPIFLGGVMKACGNTAPINIKNKDKWINIERLRWARLFNIPIAETPPEGFPPLTLGVQRALCALTLTNPERLIETTAALYKELWVERKVIHKPDALLSILQRVLGEAEGKATMEKSTSDEAKKLLTANTEKALQQGCFGLPWFIATNAEGKEESYWGFDHLGQVIDHLELERPKRGSATEGGWRTML
ncbi:MAG: hypothetical protein M1827_000735 [Pycnora praestabilis]|nr:MAG: hypothetical protein M1827_000735 [Pycnora praestabilis]